MPERTSATDGPDLISRAVAIRTLEHGRGSVVALVDRLSVRELARPGLGGGAWSPKDLVGHLESWEEHALRALDAWSRGEPAPIDRALRIQGLTAVNRGEVERKAGRSGPEALRSAAATRAELLAAIGAVPPARWRAPATARGRVPLGQRLGQILVGTRDPFGHDEAHVKDLMAFVDLHGA